MGHVHGQQQPTLAAPADRAQPAGDSTGCWWDADRDGIWYLRRFVPPVLDLTTLFFFHLNDTTGVGTVWTLAA